MTKIQFGDMHGADKWLLVTEKRQVMKGFARGMYIVCYQQESSDETRSAALPVEEPGCPPVCLVHPEEGPSCALAVGACAVVTVDAADTLGHHHGLVCTAHNSTTDDISTGGASIAALMSAPAKMPSLSCRQHAQLAPCKASKGTAQEQSKAHCTLTKQHVLAGCASPTPCIPGLNWSLCESILKACGVCQYHQSAGLVV